MMPYEDLGNAIIATAFHDWKKSRHMENGVEIIDNRRIYNECERFFKSELYRVCTTIDSETIKNKIREYEKNGCKTKKIYQHHGARTEERNT